MHSCAQSMHLVRAVKPARIRRREQKRLNRLFLKTLKKKLSYSSL